MASLDRTNQYLLVDAPKTLVHGELFNKAYRVPSVKRLFSALLTIIFAIY